MDKRVEFLEQQIDKKKNQERKKYHAENIAMYDITHDFIKKKKLLVYGGTALNLTLPKFKQFYDEHEVPDYDFFSPQAFQDAKELADIYASKHYENIEVKSGIHHGTYKVFVNFTGIADITNIPPRLFARMQEISANERNEVLKNNASLDIHVAPMAFLRMSFHLELSRPNGDIERWTKVYKRMHIFYSTYPLKYTDCINIIFDKQDDDAYLESVVNIKKFVRMHNYLVTGSEVLRYYLKHSGYKMPYEYFLDCKMTAIDIITDNHGEVASNLLKVLKSTSSKNVKFLIKAHSALYNNEVVPKHNIIYCNNKPLVGVYESQACYAYKMYNGMRITTIDTFLSMMYGWMLAERKYYDTEKIKCAINILLNLQYLKTKDDVSENRLFSPFEINCVGYQTTLLDMKKEQQTHTKKMYRPK